MRFKILGYGMLVLLLAVIVAVTLNYQASHVGMPGKVVHESVLKTFTDPAGQFEISYTKTDVLIKPDEEDLTYFSKPQVPDVEIRVPSSTFPDTTFGESYVVVATDPSIQNAADCKKYSNGASQLKATDKKEQVNGVNFDKAEFTGAAAGNRYDTRLFRVFHGGTCYEIAVTLHTTVAENYPAGTVTEVNKDEAWSKLMEILNSFKFTDKQTSSNPQCGGIAGKVCVIGEDCAPDGSYPDAGGTCVAKGDGILKGHVDIGPLCPGPERADMPCQTEPNYALTKILVYANNSTKVLQTLSLNSTGDYSVELAAGKYMVNYQTNYGMQLQHNSKSVTVPAAKSVTLDFTIDTGMR